MGGGRRSGQRASARRAQARHGRAWPPARRRARAMRGVVGGKAVGRVWCERGAFARGLLAMGGGAGTAGGAGRHSGCGAARACALVRVCIGASPAHTRGALVVLMLFLAYRQEENEQYLVKAYRLVMSCPYCDSVDGTTEGETPEVRRSIPYGTIDDTSRLRLMAATPSSLFWILRLGRQGAISVAGPETYVLSGRVGRAGLALGTGKHLMGRGVFDPPPRV